MARLVVFDHVHGLLERLFVQRRREGLRMVRADKDADVEEVIFADSEVGKDGFFGGESERRRGGSKVNGSDEFVDTRIEQSVGGTINGVDV